MIIQEEHLIVNDSTNTEEPIMVDVHYVALKYLKENGVVVEISEEHFTNLSEEYGEVLHTDFKVGDEYENLITVQLDGNGDLLSLVQVQSSPLSKHILRENNELRVELTTTHRENNDLGMQLFQAQTDLMQTQQQNNDLGLQLFNTQTELMQTQQENSDLGSQLFDLQTQLIMKGVL